MDGGYSSALILLSDTEFGFYHRAPEHTYQNGHMKTIRILANDLEEILVRRYAFMSRDIGLVVAGDVASRGQEDEYEDAEEALRELVGRLDIPKDQIAIIPGNHDVSWDQCKKAFIKQYGEEAVADSAKRKRAGASPQKLASFAGFQKRICGAVFTGPECVLDFPGFARLGVALVGFDTTFPCTFLKEDNYGVLRREVLDEGGAKLNALLSSDGRLIPMALLHHSLCPLSAEASCLHHPERVQRDLWNVGFSTVVCGHEHRASARRELPEGQQSITIGAFGANLDQLAEVHGPGCLETNRYSILLINRERQSELLVRSLSKPGDPEGTWGGDNERSASNLVLRRKQLGLIPPQEYFDKLTPILGGPKQLPDGQFVVAVRLDGPPGLLGSISSVSYFSADQDVTVQNRDEHFLADITLRSAVGQFVRPQITAECGSHLWPTAIPVPVPGSQEWA